MNYKGIVSFLANMIFNIVLMGILAYFIYSMAGKSFNTGKQLAKDATKELPKRDVTVTIEKGATLSEVAKLLEDEGIINSAFLFELENTLKGNKGNFDGGSFLLNTEMDATGIVNTLREKKVYTKDIIITIREGYTLKDIADYLESKELFSAEDFLKACNEGTYDYSFISEIPDREKKLEGYLFPDTYYIAPGSNPETVINKMLKRFEEIYLKYDGKAKAMGLTMDETIIIASIIEKEIRVDSEREKAAEVIYNRIKNNTNLQMCSTILYALDKKKDRLYDEDLKVESPYNTYTNSGLPIGPISNPGEACIKAAVNPGSGSYLYFVVKDEETGEHFFTDNYDKFLEAKQLYNQKY